MTYTLSFSLFMKSSSCQEVHNLPAWLVAVHLLCDLRHVFMPTQTHGQLIAAPHAALEITANCYNVLHQEREHSTTWMNQRKMHNREAVLNCLVAFSQFLITTTNLHRTHLVISTDVYILQLILVSFEAELLFQRGELERDETSWDKDSADKNHTDSWETLTSHTLTKPSAPPLSRSVRSALKRTHFTQGSCRLRSACTAPTSSTTIWGESFFIWATSPPPSPFWPFPPLFLAAPLSPAPIKRCHRKRWHENGYAWPLIHQCLRLASTDHLWLQVSSPVWPHGDWTSSDCSWRPVPRRSHPHPETCTWWLVCPFHECAARWSCAHRRPDPDSGNAAMKR